MSFQSFTAPTNPADGPPRLAALRTHLQACGVDGCIVPRADAHQGEYVADRDARLAWLTGFTGSAGFCIVLADVAGVFIDGRYRLQVLAQCDAVAFTPVHWPDVQPADWLRAHAPPGAVLGFDPWLHTPDEIAKLEAALAGTGITLRALDGNPVDAVWPDQPAPPAGRAWAHPLELAGRSSAEKRADVAQGLRAAGVAACVLTQPDSLCWLLNIRGADIPRIPVMQGFAIVHEGGQVDLFTDPAKLADLTLDPEVSVHPVTAFVPAVAALRGRVQIDPASCPVAVADTVASDLHRAPDPCALPKARKTKAELDGARAAHLRDGAAVVEFLFWLDGQADALCADPAHHRVTEIDAARHLESCRAATGQLHDISFDTIAGSGPNGAIVHYRVTEETDRALRPGDLMLIDSGGQYRDGTTDITRTVAIGPVGDAERAAFTRVLQGMIALSRARFPRGVTGGHLDALARYPLWLAGLDFDHGTGHGVGAFLSVHEGPQRVSRISAVPLEPGMIVSNEPGYYRAGAFGIRLENLITVVPAPDLPGADDRNMLAFQTLTLAPFDRRVIDTDALTDPEVAWLNDYHARVFSDLRHLLSDAAADWLAGQTAPL
ncbi:aminopeptidase P family protein [Roseicitreum antarcticum]|uniref:Xaa-Pro aminopeptidase n=1 Tax=Roseicitreum antarcticum TaxID=564137 RepID=A0A1H3BTI0_9RHOB|nr:aminopeptidase P family protein [Roseicitreum antarcticum]SDX44654.1 Xaa-Pro aminopeptidase [Roseicitreum antarcticum]